MAKIIIALLLIASLAGIVTSASLNALPGSPLYPFKINVTEKVGQFLTFTNYEKTEFSEDIAETRLGELQALFQNGTLTSAVEVQLISAFDTQTTTVETGVQTLVQKGDPIDALQILEDFQTSVANAVATLPSDSSIALHLQTTLASLSALSGSIATSTIKK